MDESGTDEVESGRVVAGVIRSLINARSLKFECGRVFPVLMYGCETMIWKEKSRIRAVQMENFRGLLGIKGMDKAPNAHIRELCGVMKWVGERIDEGGLRWFGHVEIAKWVYVGGSVQIDSRSVGRPRKRWIDNVKDRLEKSLDIRQARRMVHDRSEWQEFVRGE